MPPARPTAGCRSAERVGLDSWIGEISTARRRGRRAPRRGSRRRSSVVSPGTVRMSTSMSTTSGIVLVFWPPWMTLGETSCACRRGRCGRSPRLERGDRVVDAGRVGERGAQVVGQVHRRRPGPATGRRAAAPGGRRARRRTTSAAVTRALSEPYGIEPWPGVPWTRRRRQAMPFSATLTAMRRTPSWPTCRPAAGLGEHVVGADGVPVVRRSCTRHPSRRRPPRRRRRSRSACPAGGSPRRPARRNATAIDEVMLSMSMAPRPHTSPSTSSPPNGSRDQPSGFTGTTSVWPIRHSVGAVGSLPSMRATIDVRPDAASKRSTSRPAPSRYVWRQSALRASSPESGCRR